MVLCQEIAQRVAGACLAQPLQSFQAQGEFGRFPDIHARQIIQKFERLGKARAGSRNIL